MYIDFLPGRNMPATYGARRAVVLEESDRNVDPDIVIDIARKNDASSFDEKNQEFFWIVFTKKPGRLRGMTGSALRSTLGYGPFRFVFSVTFEREEDLQAYVAFWKECSVLIQQEKGALGTRLHRVKGQCAVLAIAEWTSKAARVAAYEEIARKYPPQHKIHWQAEKFGGRHSIVVEADQIGRVLPQRTGGTRRT